MHGSSKALKAVVVTGKGLLAIVVMLALIAAIPLLTSLHKTRLVSPTGFTHAFKGIGPTFQKRITSVIIIHGIGHHCIGYADDLISNLFKELTGEDTEPIKDSYRQYVRQIVAEFDDSKLQASAGNGTPMVLSISAMRDGVCQVVDDIEYDIGPDVLNQSDDLESVVLAQDDLCRAISENGKSIKDNQTRSGVDISCHKLSVKRKSIHYESEDPEYVTGFIRRFSTDLTTDSRFRVYEVTWSPATRWIKQSLMDLERFNTPDSNYRLNRRVKSEVINAGIADAVAYLADSGILVNFDILQAFCLTLANANSLYEEYPFACDPSHLSASIGDFSKNNDVHFISHSLGTRVLFDTIGMLSLGAENPNPDPDPDPGQDQNQDQEKEKENTPTLVSSIADKFDSIGARVPEEYKHTSFISDLNARIPEFAKAVRSIYVFTNQVPLLAANLTSPFHSASDVGMGFQRFLELRNPGNSEYGRLQVVSFHDPDDVLSYNLGCWYYQTMLKQFEETKDVISREAEGRAKNELGRQCDLHVTVASDGNSQQAIEKFKLGFEAKNKPCAVLAVRAASDSEEWTIARVNSRGDLLSVKIGWDLRLRVASDDDTKTGMIRNFKVEFEKNKKANAVLIVSAASNSARWTLAGFSDDEKFREVAIDESNHELWEELQKGSPDKSKILELATSSLGRTLEIDDPGDELWKELKKQAADEDSIVHLVNSTLLEQAKGLEQWRLRETLFTNNCSGVNLSKTEKHLFWQIWAAGENKIKLVDAAVRLKGFRLAWIAADPMGVHSNYFVDETVHEWLANGKGY